MPQTDTTIDPDGRLLLGTRLRVLSYLIRQAEPRHLGAIARGAGVSRESARDHLRTLTAERRVTIDTTAGPGSPRYALADIPQVRVSVKAPDGTWWEPETVTAGVLALQALADPRTLGTIGDDGRARLRAAAEELSVALAGYPARA